MENLTKIGLVVVILGLFTTAQAAEFIKPDDNSPNVSIPADQTHRNLYTAGGNVNLNGNVLGDLFTAGGSVNINAPVEQDLTAAGGTITVTAAIGGDARLGGGNITVNSPIGGDLMVGGGNVNVSSDSTIGGDLIVGSGNFNFDGSAAGKAMISGGNIHINGTIVGDVKVTATESLTFGPNSRVTGRIMYAGNKEAVVQEGAQIGTVEFTKVARPKFNVAKGLFTLAFVVQILALLVVGLAVKHYKKQSVLNIMNETSLNPLHNLGTGVLTLFATPIVAILLFVTIVGYYLGILVGLAYLFVVAFSCALAAFYLGSVVMQWIRKTKDLEFDWKTILLGAGLFKVIGWVPFIGWIVTFIVVLMVLGSVVKTLRMRHMPKPVVASPPPPTTILSI